MWRIRKLVALLLLALFVPASTANALPLVWCSTPSDHNAIELFHSFPEISGPTAKVAPSWSQPSGGHGDCIDYFVTQAVQSLAKASLVAPPSPDSSPQDLSTGLEHHTRSALSGSLIPPVLVSNQLAQLRTVVLLI